MEAGVYGEEGHVFLFIGLLKHIVERLVVGWLHEEGRWAFYFKLNWTDAKILVFASPGISFRLVEFEGLAV